MGQAFSKSHGIPLPPERLRYKVAGTDFDEWFVKSGGLSVQDLDRALSSIGRSFGEFDDVLEWGCGCGRILRHLPKPVAPKRLHGNDIDEEAIAWVRENLPWVETSTTAGLPPLAYASNSFDLIYNHSVMTHLDARYQDAWLTELSRVLKPGGIVTLTVQGRNAFQIYLDTFPPDAPERELVSADLDENGIVYIGQDQWTGDFPDFYHTTFHDVDYVFDHWSRFLTIRAFIPRGALDYQDMVVLQKPVEGEGHTRGYLEFVNSRHTVSLSEMRRAVNELVREQAASREAFRLAALLQEERDKVAGLNLVLSRERDQRAFGTQRPSSATHTSDQEDGCEISRLRDELERERTAARQARMQVGEVYASRSWKLTKPMRLIGGLIRR